MPGRGGSIGTAGRGGSGGPIVTGPAGRVDLRRLQYHSAPTCATPRFMGNTAFRAVSVACAAGIAGQAVALADKDEDIVYVPDQPNFTFANGVTVAGWFNHDAVDETRTLFRKRDGTTSAFALVLNSQKYEFVVNLGATAASVDLPQEGEGQRMDPRGGHLRREHRAPLHRRHPGGREGRRRRHHAGRARSRPVPDGQRRQQAADGRTHRPGAVRHARR